MDKKPHYCGKPLCSLKKTQSSKLPGQNSFASDTVYSSFVNKVHLTLAVGSLIDLLPGRITDFCSLTIARLANSTEWACRGMFR